MKGVMLAGSEQTERGVLQIMTSTKKWFTGIKTDCAINHQIINFLQHSSDPFNNSRIYIYRSLITIWYLSHSCHNVMQFALHSVGLIRHGLTRWTFKTYSSSRIKHAANKSISKNVKQTQNITGSWQFEFYSFSWRLGAVYSLRVKTKYKNRIQP